MLARSSNFEEDRMINLYTPISDNKIIPPPGVGFDSIVSPCLGISVFLSYVLSFSLSNNVYPITDAYIIIIYLTTNSKGYSMMKKQPTTQKI
jgi:hypothetical protein